ncbi:MAG: hypothetical protein AAF708_11155 [Deinococcota bacterium]
MERILTQHPDGKQGVNIDKQKYDQVANAIQHTLSAGETAFKDLPKAVGEQLKGNFEGSIGWYVTTVKLDLEARGVIARVKGASPQRLTLVKPITC